MPGPIPFLSAMPGPLYLDYNATTPLDEAALEAMLPYFRDHFGTPGQALHAFGWAADEAVEHARERLAALLGAEARALVFTSGGTEAVDLALRGTCTAYGARRHHIVTTEAEHDAVLATLDVLEADGYRVTRLPVGADGLVRLRDLERVLSDETLLVAVTWAHAETGVVQPMAEIARLAKGCGAFTMTDATQAVGKIPVDVEAAGIDLLALSGHRMYGPKGVGALYVRQRSPRVRLVPQLVGGAQEGGLRGGTPNVPGIVGLGKAAEVAQHQLAEDTARLGRLRDRLEARLIEALGDAEAHGAGAPRLPGTSSIRFPGAPTKKLLPKLRGLAVATGTGCRPKSTEPSAVLTAMGVSKKAALETIRFSLGRPTTEADVDRAAEQVIGAVRAVRGVAMAA